MTTILVTGAGGPAGVAVIRRLTATGQHVVAVDANAYSAGLALADEAAVLPRAGDPEYPAALIDLVASRRPEALICTVVEEMPAVNALAGQLAALGCATGLPDLAAVERCADKAFFAACMHRHGIAHPATATSFSDAVASVRGPWIVKPRRGRGSRGVVAPDSRDALRRAFDEGGDVIAQTRLAGTEFTADALVSPAGRLVVIAPRWRDETKAGISVKGTTFCSEAVTALVGAVLGAVELTGPACVQGFVDDDGRASVVEVNPRFSGGLPLTLAAGADVVSAYLAMILDSGFEPAPMDFRPGVHMVRYFAETYSADDGAAVTDPCLATAGL